MVQLQKRHVKCVLIVNHFGDFEPNDIFSARQAWLELYSNQYKYSYFRCMLAGYNTNKTTITYLKF